MGGRVQLHVGYIQKGVLGGTSRFAALINRCSKGVSSKDYYSAQEFMHHLLPLKLRSCSFSVGPINLNCPHRVKVNRPDADIPTHDSILGTNSKRQKYVSDIMEMNVINFAPNFKVANDKLINKTKKMRPRVFSIFIFLVKCEGTKLSPLLTLL